VAKNKLVPYVKAISKSKIIPEIISTTNPVDEVNPIAYASIRTTFDRRNE
jgi:hypothetical protein